MKTPYSWLQMLGHQAPNPSIERDVQGLSPSAAPHVKRSAKRVKEMKRKDVL